MSRKKRSKSSSKVGAILLALFGLPFLAVGVYMSYSAVRSVVDWRAAQGWVATPAELLSVELKTHHGESTTYEALATYRYEVGGAYYESDRIGIESGADNVGNHHQRTHRRLKQKHEAGESVTAYVDPVDPNRAVLDRDLRPEMLLFKTPFILCFGGFGLGALAGAVYVWRGGRREEDLKSRYPEQPWRWKPDWARGVVRSSNRMMMFSMGAFALFWNALSAPMLAIAFLNDDTPWVAKAMLVLFTLIGLGMIWSTFHQVLRWRKYGESTLRLASVPGVVGGQLAGVVIAPRRIYPVDGFRAVLCCIERRSDGEHSREHILWQDERRIERTLDTGSPEETAVPVLFTIPSDAAETNPDEQTSWKLKLSAKTTGTDYAAEFEAPVFRTADSREGVVADDSELTDHEQSLSLEQLLAADKIFVEPTATLGGVQYIAPPCRYPGLAIGFTVFTLIWWAITVELLLFIPWYFAAVSAIAGVGIIGLLLNIYLRRSTLSIDGERWSAYNGWGAGRGSSQEFTTADIDAIRAESSMQSGKSQWNKIVARLENGESVTLVHSVRDRRAERAIVADLRRRAGLAKEAAGAHEPKAIQAS